jgi:hypothetical protein
MYDPRERERVGRQTANDLVVLIDELFLHDDVDVAQIFSSLLLHEDVVGMSRALISGCERLFPLFVPVDPDQPISAASDALAVWVMEQIWNTPEDNVLGQAILRMALDYGRSDNLSQHLRDALDARPESDFSIATAKLVTGMSAMLAKADGISNAKIGDDNGSHPLRSLVKDCSKSSLSQVYQSPI